MSRRSWNSDFENIAWDFVKEKEGSDSDEIIEGLISVLEFEYNNLNYELEQAKREIEDLQSEVDELNEGGNV